jgi:hypothetical protein
MPNSQDNADMLWFIPMLCIFLLPSLHRAVMSEKYVEHYTKGTWFKASFLHVFTWLAITFLLTNAPFADIVAPQVDDGWGMISSSEDGFDFEGSDDGTVYLSEGYSGEHFLVLAFADNYDAADSEYTITFNGEEVNNSWDEKENNDSFSKEMKNVRDHDDIDYPVVIKIDEGLAAGTYTVIIEVVEDGDPWENTRTVELELIVEEVDEDSTK